MVLRRGERGFALPTVVVSSLILMMVLAGMLSTTSSTRVALEEQYYNQLSREAAEAGQIKAAACIAQTGTPAWTDAKPLMPNTDCSGNVLAACPANVADCYIATSGNIRTYFSIGAATVLSNGRAQYSVSAYTQLTRPSSGLVWKSFQNTVNYTNSFNDTPYVASGTGLNGAGATVFVNTYGGKMYGFGANSAGQVSDTASPLTVLAPQEMSLPAGVTSAKKVMDSGMGQSFLCIIGVDEQAYCRGSGMGLTAAWTKIGLPASYRAFDLSVNGGTVATNGSGTGNMCVLAGVSTMDMQAYCVGWNAYGQLGNGTTTNVPLAAATRFGTPAGLTVKSVETQSAQTCVIASNDKAYCAGRNDVGQITANANTNVTTPSDFAIYAAGGKQRKVKQIIMPYYGSGLNIAALTTDGSIWISGDRTGNLFGNTVATGNTGTGYAEEWGNAPTGHGYHATGGDIRSSVNTNQCIDNNGGTLADQNPVQFYTCNNGVAQKWMYTDDTQALWLTLDSGGTGSNFCLDIPGGNAVSMQQVKVHTCNQTPAQRWNILPNGSIQSVLNPSLCLDTPDNIGTNGQPVVLYGCSGSAIQKLTISGRVYSWRGIIATANTICGIRSDIWTGVWCAGDNSLGQMANVSGIGGGAHGTACGGTSGGAANMNILGAIKVDVSKFSKNWQYQYNSLLVIGTDGQVYGAGANMYGKLGNGTLGESANSYRECYTKKMQLPAGVSAVDMSTRSQHSTYVLGNDGKVYSMGLNNLGQLGDGTTTNRLSPVPLSLPRTGYAY